jgi:uncharacterized membrane protein YqgA involved in biofilm formation
MEGDSLVMIPGLGTLVNVVVVIAGSIAGALIRKGLPERFKDNILQSIGLAVVMIGISGALQNMFQIAENGSLDRVYIMTLIFSLIIGGIIGEILNIDDKLNNLGEWFRKKIGQDGGSFSEGFVTASLVFCVGAMAIVGSLEDGLMGNPNTLFAKSVLDGVASVIFASTFGIGVALSALPVLVYQGGITLLAAWIKPWLTEPVISQMSLVGSVLIFCIGISMLGIKKFKVGNLLPSIFMPLIYFVIASFC